jgi:hypothetical protein
VQAGDNIRSSQNLSILNNQYNLLNPDRNTSRIKLSIECF